MSMQLGSKLLLKVAWHSEPVYRREGGQMSSQNENVRTLLCVLRSNLEQVGEIYGISTTRVEYQYVFAEETYSRPPHKQS